MSENTPQKTKLVCFRLTKQEKQDFELVAELQGVSMTNILRRYTLHLVGGKAEIHPPIGPEVY